MSAQIGVTAPPGDAYREVARRRRAADLGALATSLAGFDPDGSPLLASNHQSSPRTIIDDDLRQAVMDPITGEVISEAGCPNRVGFFLFNWTTGAVRPARCGTLSCGYCRHYLAVQRAAAIALSAPQRAILLTQVGNDFQTTRQRVNKLREGLQRRGIDPGEWVWHVEPNPAGTGRHVHAWQHGPDPIPVRKLSQVAEAVGMGPFARIQRVRSTVGASRYGLKGVAAMGYGLKGLEQSDAYLEANGDRLTHQSRGFFRSERGTMLSVRGAEARALRHFTGRDEGLGTWEIVSAAYLAARRDRLDGRTGLA